MAICHNKKEIAYQGKNIMTISKRKKKNPKLCFGWGRVILTTWLEDRRVVGLGTSLLGFGISLLCVGSSIPGLGSGILELKGSLWTLGLWQGLDLLAFALIL